MGMYDESWCCSCGGSIPYAADESAMCGACASEEGAQLSEKILKVVNYMKLHLISLNQDLEKNLAQQEMIDDLDSDEYRMLEIEEVSLNGQWIATEHIMSVATGILLSSNERE